MRSLLPLMAMASQRDSLKDTSMCENALPSTKNQNKSKKNPETDLNVWYSLLGVYGATASHAFVKYTLWQNKEKCLKADFWNVCICLSMCPWSSGDSLWYLNLSKMIRAIPAMLTYRTTLYIVFRVIWYFMSLVTFLMTLLMNKVTSIVIPTYI
jgi:hypothetical protein